MSRPEFSGRWSLDPSATPHPWLEWKGVCLQLVLVVRIEGEVASQPVRLMLGEDGAQLHTHEHFRGFGQDHEVHPTFVRS